MEGSCRAKAADPSAACKGTTAAAAWGAAALDAADLALPFTTCANFSPSLRQPVLFWLLRESSTRKLVECVPSPSPPRPSSGGAGERGRSQRGRSQRVRGARASCSALNSSSMEWLRSKRRGSEAKALEQRPGSSGEARDLDESVTLEGISEAAGDADGNEQALQANSQKGASGDVARDLGTVLAEEGKEEDEGDTSQPSDLPAFVLAGRLFDSIDKSGDGSISREELVPALLMIGYTVEGAEMLYSRIDEDGEGGIDKAEFIDFFDKPGNGELFRKLRYAGIKTKVPKNVPIMKTGTAGPARGSLTNLAMQEIWDQHDGDRDGWLTEEQLYDAMRSVGIRLKRREKHELRREIEDNLELWSGSDDSAMPSDASVASDIDAEETVYEDCTNVVRVLQNHPRDSIERLVVNDKGVPEFQPVLAGEDKLDRDKPAQFANWVAATCTPGLSLVETKAEIIARTKFCKLLHENQIKHETNELATERLRFQRAWNDRSLERSPDEERFWQWLKDLRTKKYWRDLVSSLVFRLKKQVLEEHEGQEMLSRGRRTLTKGSVEIKPRNVLDRVNQSFVDDLIQLDDDERRARFEEAFDDVCAREEAETLGVRATIRAMRSFGASLNSAEVFSMMEELAGEQAAIHGDLSLDVSDFCDLSEHLFNAVTEAGSKDKVCVFIQEASDLPVMDRFGSADPFVTVEVVNRPDDDRRRTATRKQSLNPAWQSDITIYDVTPSDVLMVSMWDDEESGFGATLIGEFTVCLRDVQEAERINTTTNAIEKWFELVDDHGKFIIGKFGCVTKLRTRVSYVKGSLRELKQKPLGPQNVDFSLITIKVKAAEHLPKMDKGAHGSVDPYCVISFFDHRIRTCTVEQSYSPVWDEAFVLSADSAEGEVLVTMYDYDEEGRDDPIGTCKVHVALMTGEPVTKPYELRTLEENSLVIGKDGEKTTLWIEASISRNEQMKEVKSLLEILFEGMACDNHATVLATCSALWQMLQHDDDYCERDALHVLNRWQTMADVLLTGVLEFNVHSATDLPRMDYFGLCDPYVTIEVDGVHLETEVKKTTLDPTWNQTLRLPTFSPPMKPSAPQSEKATILVRLYDWDKVGEHDLIGCVIIPLEDWLGRGPRRSEWDIVGEPEKVRSLRPGEPDQIIRKPIIGHSGKPSKLQMTIDYTRRVVVMDECMEEMSWAIAFASIQHAQNAESFGQTLGGIGGLVSQLRKPIPEGTNGEAIQAACYALGNLAASHKPNQKMIMENRGIERLLDLISVTMPAMVQRAACLALAAVVGDNSVCIARVLEYHSKDPEMDELVQRAGGIGTLLVLLRDVRPDPNFRPPKGTDQDGWGVVTEIFEACIKAIAAAAFVETKGLWFTNATSFFSKADQRATVRQLAMAIGRPGLAILQDLARLPWDNQANKDVGAKRANKETIHFANLIYQSLDAAYGSG